MHPIMRHIENKKNFSQQLLFVEIKMDTVISGIIKFL